MQAGQREEKMIQYLLKQSSYVTVAALSGELDISSKTAYRIIKKLNDETGDALIVAEKGKGVRINYDIYLKSRFNRQQKAEGQSVYYNFSPVERRLHILKELLFQAPLSLREDTIFSRYYLSTSAIYNDEKIISRYLSEYGLKLQKNGSRLSVSGAERNIRKALIKILAKLNLLNFDDLNHISVGFNQADLRFVIRQLEFIEKEIDSLIPAPYNVNLLTHLYIMIYRAGRGGADTLEQAEHVDLSRDRYYEVAKKVTKNIESYLCRELPESETANICRYLNGSRVEPEQKNAAGTGFSDEVMEITDFYMQRFAEAMNMPAISETGGLSGLSSHIKPLLNRLRSRLTVRNPLLEDIRSEYGQIFDIVKVISGQVAEKFHLPPVDDDENGFITLYFARYMEQNPQKVRTLIICTTGLGTSELLRTKVNRFFPELDIIGTAATCDINAAYLQEKQVDLILTTVRAERDWPVPVVLVNILFIERDKENVRAALKAMRR